MGTVLVLVVFSLAGYGAVSVYKDIKTYLQNKNIKL